MRLLLWSGLATVSPEVNCVLFQNSPSLYDIAFVLAVLGLLNLELSCQSRFLSLSHTFQRHILLHTWDYSVYIPLYLSWCCDLTQGLVHVKLVVCHELYSQLTVFLL